MLPTLQLAALTALLFIPIGSFLGAVLYRHLRGSLLSLQPAARARALLAWSAAPLVSSVGLTAACFLPSVLALIGWSDDHCPLHAGHPHLCLLHPPAPGSGGWILPAVAGVLALTLTLQLLRLQRASRLRDALLAASRHDPAHGVLILDSDRPLALTAGVLHPQVLLSSGLTKAVPADAIEAVLAHERAHVRRRDGLWQLLASMLSLSYLPRIRRQLLADLALACEQACDEEAAHTVGSRLRIAEALLAVERLFQASPPITAAGTISIRGGNLAERVGALLDEPIGPSSRHRRWLVSAIAAVLGAVGLAAEPLHHLTETLLGFLAG